MKLFKTTVTVWTAADPREALSDDFIELAEGVTRLPGNYIAEAKVEVAEAPNREVVDFCMGETE